MSLGASVDVQSPVKFESAEQLEPVVNGYLAMDGTLLESPEAVDRHNQKLKDEYLAREDARRVKTN